MAVAMHSENIELQEEDHANYENEPTITARRINVEMSEEGHYDRLDLQKIDDTVYGDLQTKKDLQKIPQSVRVRVVAVSLGMLCLMLLGVIIGLVLYYSSVINHLRTTKTDSTNLTLERNQLKSDYTNLMLDNNELKNEVNQLKAVKTCPDGWMKFGDRCYYISTEEKTWEESRIQCQEDGADLVIINSKEEQELIGRLNHGCEVPSEDTWIGLKSTGSKWTSWVDRSPLTTGYWASGWPDSAKGDCAYYWQRDGQWYNLKCSDRKTWICEK